MARLETEINQIYLTHPESKKCSLVLYEEVLTNSSHLFILAELKGLQRKSEAADLKKITEIILKSFRSNKKLVGEILFESALAQINQNLADLAHEGHKSWVGKFSCLICLKHTDNIYLANNGQTQAFLLRKSELLETLSPEKRGTHPLKTFTNFTQGKLQNGDALVITTSNIFNFISLELFTRLITDSSLADTAAKISKILQDSMTADLGFCAFLLSFGKKSEAVKPEPTGAIYAPLPEEIEKMPTRAWRIPLAIPKFKLNIPHISLPKIRWNFFQNLSKSGKFFFISFSIFLLLFLGNLSVYGIKLQGQTRQNRINAQADILTEDINAARSALIYKNNDDAFRLLEQAKNDFKILQKLNQSRATEFSALLETLEDQINKVSVVTDPNVFVELKHKPIYLNRSSIGFLFANQDSNSISLFDTILKDYFLLNSLKSDIMGIGYYSPAGIVVASGSSIYHIDQNLKQLEPIITTSGATFVGLKTYGNSFYTLNPTTGQVIKTNFSKSKYSSIGINTGSQENIRDLGADKDIYLLFTDKIVKITNNQIQAFPYPALTDPITNATKIFVGSNIYILEANKKRVIILNKNGQLLNQIYFPNASSLFDLAVDEAARNLYLLDDNKLYKITF